MVPQPSADGGVPASAMGDGEGLARLGVTLIRMRTDPGSFDRGSDYYRKGMILDPVRRGATLRAACRGSSGGPYRVEATLATAAEGGENPVDYFCECPRGGFCKHVVALLLTWVKTPERFDVRPPVADVLAGKSREELAALVEALLRRAPEFESLLDRPVLVPVAVEVAEPGTGAANVATVEAAAIRRQVVVAFESDERGGGRYGSYGSYRSYDDYEDEYSHDGIAARLAPLVGIGDRYAAAGRWGDALVVYGAIAGETLAQGDEAGFEFYDEDPIMGAVSACGAGLVRCLDAQATLGAADRLDAGARTELVERLYEIWDAGGSVADDEEAERGGYDAYLAARSAAYADEGGGYEVAEDEEEYIGATTHDDEEWTGDGDDVVVGVRAARGDGLAEGVDIAAALARHATAAERAEIEQKLRASIKATAAQPYQQYATRESIRFLMALQPDAGDEGLLAAFREAGLWEDAAATLLRLGRVEEAVGVAGRHLTEPRALLGFADRLLGMGGKHVDGAFALVDGRLWETEGVKHHDDMTHLEWLGARYASHGRAKEALGTQQRRFKRRPDHATYEAVKGAATLPGQAGETWAGLRPGLLAELRKQAAWGPLIEVHLKEGEVGEAIAALAKMEKGERRTATGGYGYWGWGAGTYRARVAQAAEGEFPDEAIRLYRLLADGEIAGRSREHYRQAAGYLARVQALEEGQGRGAEWRAWIGALREEHKRLRALQDELKQAGVG